MWLFDPNGYTVGDIYQVVQRNMAKNKVKRKRKTDTTTRKGRHVMWSPGTNYICVRKPEIILSGEEVETMFKSKQLHEKHFYIFKNNDPHVERNEEIPLYEAVYKRDNVYIKAQKCHMKQAYLNAGRTDNKKIWNILEDDTPYHVDRFAFCKQRQINSKKKIKN